MCSTPTLDNEKKRRIGSKVLCYDYHQNLSEILRCQCCNTLKVFSAASSLSNCTTALETLDTLIIGKKSEKGKEKKESKGKYLHTI